MPARESMFDAAFVALSNDEEEERQIKQRQSSRTPAATNDDSHWLLTSCWHCCAASCNLVKDAREDLAACCVLPSALRAAPLISDPVVRLNAQRRCTDVFCTVLFVLVQLGALLVAAAAFSTGDPRRLTHGTDYTGRLCQSDTYYPRLGDDLRAYREQWASSPFELPAHLPLYGVCVERCPEAGEWVEGYGCPEAGPAKCEEASGEAAEAASGEAAEAEKNATAPDSWLVPVSTVSVMRRCVPWPHSSRETLNLCTTPTCDQLAGDDAPPCYTGLGTAAAKYWEVTTSEQRSGCLQLLHVDVTQEYRSPTNDGLEMAYVSGFFRGATPFFLLVQRAMPEMIVFGIMLSPMVSLSLLGAMRYAVRGVFHLLVLMLFLLLLILNVIAWAQAGVLDVPAVTNTSLGWIEDISDWATNDTTSSSSSNSALSVSGLRNSLTEQAERSRWFQQTQTTLLGMPAALLLAVCALIAIGGLAYAVHQLWPSVDASIRIIREATSVLHSSSAGKSLLLLPLLTGLVGCGILLWLVAVITHLMTPQPMTDAYLQVELVLLHAFHVSVSPATIAAAMAAYSALACVWLLAFTRDLAYTITASYVTYDFLIGSRSVTDEPTAHRYDWPLTAAATKQIGYHSGSIAFGAAAVGIARSIRRLLEFVMGLANIIKDLNPLCSYNPCLAPASALLSLANWGFESVIKYIAVFGYTFVASDGCAFLPACVQTFHLVTDYPMQLAMCQAAQWVFTLLLSFTAPLLCATLAYFATLYEWRGAVASSGVAPLVVVGSLDDDWSEGGAPSAGGVAVLVFLLAGWVTKAVEHTFNAVADTLLMVSVRDHRDEKSWKRAKPGLTAAFEMDASPPRGPDNSFTAKPRVSSYATTIARRASQVVPTRASNYVLPKRSSRLQRYEDDIKAMAA